MRDRVWRSRADFAAIGALIFTVIVFYFRLFFPQLQLIVTPDFGRSDAWHSSFSSKFFLSECLKNNELPLWNPYVGTGYPMHAEGLIGTFFLPNLILFRIFDAVPAYNAALAVSVGLFGIGVYTWLRTLRFDPVPALFCGLVATLSGIIVSQLTHMMILPSLALLPFILAAIVRMCERVSVGRVAVVGILLSQQHFAGFPQTTFITAVFAFAFVISAAVREKDVKPLFGFFAALLLSVLLAAAQLLPSFEFLRNTTTGEGFAPSIASFFSFPVKHLVTLLHPFALGNPKVGTYPDFETLPGSIFWENTGYIGIVPLVLALVAPFLHREEGARHTRFFTVSLVLSFLLMTGRNSPLYFVFTLWPFSLFRVPSRFLWIFTLSLLGLCAETIQRIWYRKKHPIFSRAIVSVTLVITIIQLAHTWRDYHLLAPSSAWLTTPTIAAYIADGIRFTVIGAEAKHNETFLTHGWQDPLPYERIRQLAQPNSNGIWHIRSRDVYAGRSLRRLAVIDGMLSNHIAVNPPYATVSAMGAKLLAIQSVGIIVSPLQLDAPEYKTIESVGRGDNFSVSVYPQIVPRVSIVRKTIEAATVEDAIQILESEAYQVGITALVELSLTLDRSEQQADARIVSETNQTMTVLVQNPGPAALLVVTDTYYPGWVATVNGTPTRIIPVNIASRGVVIPPGNSEVLMKFASQSVRYGIMISLSAHAIIAILAVFVRARVFVHTRQKVRSRGLHHPRSREVLPPHRR